MQNVITFEYMGNVGHSLVWGELCGEKCDESKASTLDSVMAAQSKGTTWNIFDWQKETYSKRPASHQKKCYFCSQIKALTNSNLICACRQSRSPWKQEENDPLETLAAHSKDIRFPFFFFFTFLKDEEHLMTNADCLFCFWSEMFRAVPLSLLC